MKALKNTRRMNVILKRLNLLIQLLVKKNIDTVRLGELVVLMHLLEIIQIYRRLLIRLSKELLVAKA